MEQDRVMKEYFLGDISHRIACGNRIKAWKTFSFDVASLNHIKLRACCHVQLLAAVMVENMLCHLGLEFEA